MSKSTSATAAVPVVILNGFLGSGKTTLLRNLLSQCHRQEIAVSVVVNDMSELDIDGLLISDTDLVGREDHSFASIWDDSLSSPSGLQKLDAALADMLAHRRPELIIIETSGSAHPLPLVDFFRHRRDAELKAIFALADAVMLNNDYNGGADLIPLLQKNLQAGRRDTVNLLAEQIMFSSHLLLTKADRLQPGELESIAQAVHPLNPYVSIMSLSWGRFSLDQLFSMPSYDFHRVGQLLEELRPLIDAEPSARRPFNLATRVIRDERPLHPQRLWQTCNSYLGQEIYRSKGYFWLPTRDKLALLWNQAAGSISLELVSYWRAGILEQGDHGLAADELEQFKQRVARESGRFGDRICHLTIIGDADQVDIFANALQDCFLSEEEIEFWKSGGQFEDPWPRNLMKVKH